MARAIDIGTCWLVAASQDANNQIKLTSIRDSFIDLDNDESSGIKNMLSMSKVDYIESGDKLYVIGDNANVIAGLFKRELRRPLSKGVLSPGEAEAERIIVMLIERILGRASVKGEICYYSVPGNPADRQLDIIYHQAIFSKILGNLNYTPKAMNEASAIIFSNAAKEEFSGIALSCGAGMINVALLYKTVTILSFSIINSGDWLDEMASKAVGGTSAHLQFIKEKGLDLLNSSEGDPRFLREREALTIYYKSLVLRVLDVLKNEFIKKRALSSIELPNAIPMIISGGTAKAKNFLEFFTQGFNTVKDFPISISEIRLASGDLLNSVAQGLLVRSLNEESSLKK